MEKPKNSPKPARLNCCGIILLILVIGLGFVGCVAVTYGSVYYVSYFNGSRPIPGDASKFDAVAASPQIAQYAGSNVQLLSILMKFVKADGTLDLTADYGAEVDYTFAQVIDPSTNTAPLGAGGGSNQVQAEQILVNVAKPGIKDNGDNTESYNFGLNRETDPATPLTQTIVPPPSCSAKQLWAVALKKDAPANAVATIRYDSSGYSFSIQDTQVDLQFDAKCQLQK